MGDPRTKRKSTIMLSTDATWVPHYRRPNELQRSINEHMIKLIPETDCSFAKSPLHRKRWYTPSEEYEPGVPCYIPSDNKNTLKKNYIWMPKQGKNLQAGYYHLSTQEAHIQIFRLFRERRSRRLFRKNTPEMKLESEIYNLLKNRLLSDRPNDQYAARMKYFLAKSQGGRSKDVCLNTAYLPVISAAFLSGLS